MFFMPRTPGNAEKLEAGAEDVFDAVKVVLAEPSGNVMVIPVLGKPVETVLVVGGKVAGAFDIVVSPDNGSVVR